MKRKIVNFFLSLSLLLLSVAPATAEDVIFLDMNSNHWAFEAVSDMVSKGVINGYSDNSFKPQNSITREEFAKLITSTFNIEQNSPSEPTFYDVQQGKWSYPYVEAAKTYLTGYFPPVGKPFFSPGMNATREDVAVALVKALGYTVDDLENQNILERTFTDVDSISYNVRDYVAIAVENKLMTGYPDDTFRGESTISRAEVATLLYRSIKGAAVQDQPQLSINMPATVNTKTFTISGQTNKDAKVTINNEEVYVNSYNGQFEQSVQLPEEGTYTFVISSKVMGRPAVTETRQVVYAVAGSVITINHLPETTSSKTIEVSGSVTDPVDTAPILYLNDTRIYYNSYYSNEFKQSVTLSEGENTLVFKAVNQAGKTTTVTKKVTFQVNGPEIKLEHIPESTDSKSITIAGKVTDANDNYPTIYINGKKVNTDYYGGFTQSYTLAEGQNTFEFLATNSSGKSTKITKKVTLEIGGPKISIDYLPETLQAKSFELSGTVKDSNDSNLVVYLNNKRIYLNYGKFNERLTFKDGKNTITIVATNSFGKTSTLTKEVVVEVSAPELTFEYIPSIAQSKKLTIYGNVTDENDSYPSVYYFDKKLSTNSYGDFSVSIDLLLGENSLMFKAVNSFGKTTTVTKSVYYY